MSIIEKYNTVAPMYLDCVLLIQCGDFYEALNEHAIIMHRELSISLTARNKDGAEPVPMCGFPYYALHEHIETLTGKGYRVAVCEFDHNTRREVVRVHDPKVEVVEI